MLKMLNKRQWMDGQTTAKPSNTVSALSDLYSQKNLRNGWKDEQVVPKLVRR
jgi:hypothetical protein